MALTLLLWWVSSSARTESVLPLMIRTNLEERCLMVALWSTHMILEGRHLQQDLNWWLMKWAHNRLWLKLWEHKKKVELLIQVKG